MTLTIREAARADAPLIINLIRELARYERAPDAAKASLADIETAFFGADPKVHALIAEWNGAAVGFAVYFFNFSTWTGKHGVYLEDLFVRESVRGKGIGKALLMRLAAIARARDCARLEWSVLDWNEPAIGFYRSLGAKAMDEWTVYRVEGEALSALAGER
ncbi:MAG: GNAT family N-acetyltransferase [Parvularculaceae bacterium]